MFIEFFFKLKSMGIPVSLHEWITLHEALSKNLDNCSNCQALFEIDWEVSSDTVVKPDTIVICYEPEEKITKKPGRIRCFFRWFFTAVKWLFV
ncbi:MAG: hypothetical protein DRG20_05785, partial [Deltaproteobacteria bacterium]